VRNFKLILALWLICFWATSPAFGDKVRLVVIDADTNSILPARAYLKCGGKPVIPPGLPSYRRGLEEHFLLKGEDILDLPAGDCEIRVERGTEYEPNTLRFTAKDGLRVEVRLKRWANMNEAGWYSADMHVHRNPKELAQILLAEDLNFAPTITYHVWSNEASTPFPAEAGGPIKVDERHFYTANSQEVERIQGGPGAIVLFAKDLPIPFDGYEYYPPAVRYTRAAHAQGGYVGGDKVFWLDTYVNAALGELDFIELNCNHFLPYDVDTDLIPWSHWPVEMGYYGDLEFAYWMMDSYYRILNCGLNLPLSAGSASGVKATPVGYDRVYAYLGTEPFTYENFMRVIKTGRTFGTNGPLLDLRINGEIGPGLRLAVRKGQDVKIEGTVRSRVGLNQVDLVVNGKVYRRYFLNGDKEFRLTETITARHSCWVALRAFEPAERTVVFGHTSPGYLEIDNEPVRIREDAEYLVRKIDELIRYTEQKAAFRDPQHKQETLDLYRQARKVYEAVARESGIGH